ncbi:MAG: 2-C-methyl-D-erythritol 4-phosphate cytidylyltransferase [Actinomycetota bacterium]
MILGAGNGVRMGQAINKVYLEIEGLPIIVRAARPFALHRDINHLVIVAAEHEIDRCKRVFHSAGIKVNAVIAGGKTRHASETCALEYLAPKIQCGEVEFVLIHDGARPFFDGAMLNELLERARSSGGAICALPLEDDLTHLEGQFAESMVDHAGFWQAQTPQVFRAQLLLDAYRSAAAAEFEGTDTAASVERMGGTVEVIRGDVRNIKITQPDDLVLAESLIKAAGGSRR